MQHLYGKKNIFKIKNMENITISPIGIIRTPFKDVKGMPVQPMAADGVKGYIELKPEYCKGLKDIEGFSHLTLVYRFHKIEGYSLEVTPFMDIVPHGIFATRSPKRPNAIGISTVRLIEVKDNRIYIEQVDMLDETPLIDIKPFYPRYDNRTDTRAGWLEKNPDLPMEKLVSDERFK